MEENWIPHPTILRGQVVELLPLEQNHFPALLAAASDQRIWEFYPGDWSKEERFEKIYTAILASRDRGQEYPFVIIYKPTQKIIGSTRLMDIVPYDKRLEIGGTWLMPEYWASAVNIDCKLALLTYCFESLHTHRVQLKTQHNNIRSRKAIEKIGGVYEGIIREHMLKDDGSYRSSAYFSILASEWPGVKMNLKTRLSEIINNKMN
ncbi:MAG: GNAT family N-acetyltransferase [Saprospiraceae bacterium]|uniref:GNAT family N-acetyltransferase n=1 Tax=Candidatus Opimibacter skivensis TaxID=2982028 RepID=A0A9D7SXA5_9BACT|nr:GNAT family N-acetyltransferase [Candidatus Opimibacter skivensis]